MTTIKAIGVELRWAWIACRPRSFIRYGADVFMYRAMRVRRPRGYGRRRSIVLRNGVQVTYRLARADIQTVREVWFQETYRLPFELPGAGGTLVDLGGNIGLASVYLARRHAFARIVIVEPVAENAALARLNCERNGIDAEIIQAAVASEPGVANFVLATELNQGHIDAGSTAGTPVRATTVPEIVGPAGTIRLLKMDIEGGEGPLLADAPNWLDGVLALVAEFHPDLVDYPKLLQVLEQRGFTFFPGGSVLPFSADAFLHGPGVS